VDDREAFPSCYSVDEPGHLDWYEENYGEIEDSLEDEVDFLSSQLNRNMMRIDLF
jgi:hypothetical protein